MKSYKIWSGLQRRTANPANASVIPIPMEALIAAVRHGVLVAECVRHGVLVAECVRHGVLVAECVRHGVLVAE